MLPHHWETAKETDSQGTQDIPVGTGNIYDSLLCGIAELLFRVMHGSLEFMVNNNPVPMVEPEDKGSYCKP